MAAAETARLVASLELQDKNFTRGIRNVERGVGRVDKKLSAFGGFVNRNLARGIDSFAANLVGGVFQGVESLKELEQQQAQTAAVIKSTGGAAGVSAEEITNLAEKYEGLNAIMGDEVIRSGENMLLTFTNITEDAFEPALAAILDMNTAMGKGPEGLTSTAIQVGKALNDPTKGLTALSRVGVSFTKDQVKRIKGLQKEGKLYEAQQIILAELNKEFGGSFAAQGDTTAGKVAKFHDAVEDLQRTFAKALLPVIVKVADKLGELFADPKVVAAIEAAGEGLARAFDGVLSAAEKINWAAIGGGLEKAAGFAGELVGWFGKFPDWAQALIVGGFVATKLPIVGDIFSEAAKGLIKGVLGINAGIVNVNGPVAGMGGAPVPGAGAGGGMSKLMNLLKTGIVVGIAAASIVALAETFKGFIDQVGASQKDLLEKVNQTSTQGFEETIANLQSTNKTIQNMNPLENVLAGIFGGSEIQKNFEMGADRIVGQLKAGALDRDEIVTALKTLTEVRETSPEAELPKTDAAIAALTEAIRGMPRGDPKQPLPVPKGPTTVTIKPGDAMFALFARQQASTKASIDNAKSIASRENSATREKVNQVAVKAQATANAVKQAQSIASRENSAQRSEIARAKQAAATAGIRTSTAARAAGTTTAAAMSAAAGRIVGAVNSLDLSVNVTTVNRTSTVNNRYGPSGGSSTTNRSGELE